jgi:lipopolysaccharide biosynthesis regulator YciM
VIALVDGKKVISPSASAPETKFAVLSAADLQELTRLKKSKSHLALGVFYARAGLLNEAEREFQNLVKLNPQSELPRKLLRSVRSTRKAD